MKLRVSFSLLSMWRRGQYQQAIDSYLHKKSFTSQAMEDGIMWDTHVTEYVDLYKKLPEEFGGDELISPQAQKKFTIPYNEECDLSILPDIIDQDTLWENKSGIKDSADYASDFQIAMYFLGLGLAKVKIEKAIINHYNQHTNLLDRTLIWNTPQEIARGKNFIDSLYPEIYEYFKKQGILTL